MQLDAKLKDILDSLDPTDEEPVDGGSMAQL